MRDVRLIDANALIYEIENTFCDPCKTKGGDYHGIRCRACGIDDTIQTIEDAPTFSFDCYKDMSNITICGYRASDLVIFAERMRSPERVADIDNDLLKDNNKAFIDGYNKAHQEIQEQIDRICNNIGGNTDI